MRPRALLLSSAGMALIALGGLTFWSVRDRGDAAELANTRITITRQDTAISAVAATAAPSATTSIAPGFDAGEVLRLDGGSAWYRQQIHDRADSPQVLGTTVCPGQPAFVAVGHLGDELTGSLDQIDRAEASVWRSIDGTEWSPVELDGRPQEATLLDVASGESFGQPSLLVAVGQTLNSPVTAIVAVSSDCGATWTIDELAPGADSLPASAYLIAGAVTADQSGFLIAGATETGDGRSVILWSSEDARTWTAQTGSNNATLSGVPDAVRRVGDAVVIVERDASVEPAVLYFDGEPGSWFTGGPNAGPYLSTSALAADGSSLVIVGQSKDGDWHELVLVGPVPDAYLADRLPWPDPADVGDLRLVETSEGLQLVVETTDFELVIYRLERS